MKQTVTESDQAPQRVKDQPRLNDTVVVKLSKVLDRCDALLIVLEVVDLHSDADVLEHVVDDRDAEVGVVTCEVVEEDGEEVDVRVLDLPDFDEGVVELANDLQAVRAGQ